MSREIVVEAISAYAERMNSKERERKTQPNEYITYGLYFECNILPNENALEDDCT